MEPSKRGGSSLVRLIRRGEETSGIRSFCFFFYFFFYTEFDIVIPRFAREIVLLAPTDRFDRND